MSIDVIVRQHAEDAASAWWLRLQANRSPETSWNWLLELDTRIRANLDGLMESLPSSVDLLYEQYSSAKKRGAIDAPADEFVALLLDAERLSLQIFIETAQSFSQSSAWDGLFAWSTAPTVKQAIHSWSMDIKSKHYKASIQSLYLHDLCDSTALSPSKLEQAIPDGVEFQAVVDCGRTDLLDAVIQRLRREIQTASASTHLHLARSALLLGEGKYSRAILERLVNGASSYANAACYWLSLSCSRQELDALLKNLRISQATKLEIQSIAWAGEVRYLPYLIELIDGDFMEAAINAIAIILGEQPFHGIAGPAEIITPQRAVNRAELSRRLSLWWEANRQSYDSDATYLAGKRITPHCLVDVLVQDQKRHRDIAADRLKLIFPNRPRFAVEANTQTQWLQHLALRDHIDILIQSN